MERHLPGVRLLAMGVDGMRLDAVPYLYERENSNCENLPETHGFLKAMRKHVDDKFANRMLLAEANQWPEDSVAYFGQGDECHMAFHFPVMPRLFMAIHMEDRFPILDIMAQTPRIPDNCQWGMFLRNHDELTLEMVTDEERDYMYRAYAADPRARINLGIRHRLAPLLGNDRRRIELMNGLLFSLPGTPVLYYGDEIGMGDNIYLGDRNGVRTPMQWTADRNAGFSRANPQRLYLPVIIDPEYHYEAVNVEAQQNNPNSLLWWMKRLIALRKRYKAFGRGTLEFLLPSNRKVLAFLRRYQDETILVVANLSRFVQQTELDLSAFDGMVPVEMFGQTAFPRLGKQPYTITLAGHAFYWIALTPAPVRDTTGHARSTWQVPTVRVGGGWQDVLRKHAPERLEPLLPAYIRRQPWYTGGHRAITGLTIRDQIPFRYGDAQAFVLILLVEYNDGPRDTFVLPIAFAPTEAAVRLQEGHAHAAIVRVEGKQEGVVFDALHDARFCEAADRGGSHRPAVPAHRRRYRHRGVRPGPAGARRR
ncbi:MAG: alpha-glucosidase C-terminal domain-containing protein [Gemmataceae bacterium]